VQYIQRLTSEYEERYYTHPQDPQRDSERAVDLAQLKQKSFLAASDQLLFNELATDGCMRRGNISSGLFGSHLRNLSRVAYNAFPAMTSYANGDVWSKLGKLHGDETAATKVVHFAGIYGGISVETGQPDFLLTLLSVREFVQRHLYFLKELQRKELKQSPERVAITKNKIVGYIRSRMNSSSVLVSTSQAITIVQSVIELLDLCLDRVFAMFDVDLAEREALQCLARSVKMTRALFTQPTEYLFSKPLVF
jgi:hypothetical protein